VTSDQDLGRGGRDVEVSRRRTYVAVVCVEVLVILALWAFGRYFGSL
jgi:hypothetical protein